MLTRSQSLRTAIKLAIQSREKNTTGLVALIGNHIEIWIHSSELDSPESCRSGVLRSGEKGQVGLSLGSVYMDLEIPMKV